MIPVAILAGVLLLIAAAALRRNTPRAQSWDNGGILDDAIVYLTLPGTGMLLLGFGLLGLTTPLLGAPGAPGVIAAVGALPAGALALTGAVLALRGLFTSKPPAWALPKWRRED